MVLSALHLLAALAVGLVAATVILGIRSLSADYLIRVSSIMHGGSATKTEARRSWIGGIVALLFGGQPGRAGIAFVSRMMRRDFQFRRQAALWIPMVVIPHGIMLLLFVWPWGMWHAGLFVAYSAAVSSVYLALELRLIEGAPFSKQVDATRGAMLLPLMMLGGVVMAIAVGLQYYLVFRSPATVVMATVVVGAAAYFLTRSSLDAFEVSIRYNLGLLSAESGTLYREIDV